MQPIDVFHFENALNNIIDNAVKYGGEEISVTIEKKEGNVEIQISDSGNELTDEHKKYLFEKFYRVPKGNTHDVKGFGIGLYYAKQIIEKHGGTIDLHLNKLTTFKIVLPNDPKN
jgi:two-component system phosphate regulon sensor histidine kinase PhoR